MTTGSLIHQSNISIFNGKMDKPRYDLVANDLYEYNKKTNGGDFLTPLNHYLGLLENIDPVLFPYMNEKKKKQCLRDLQVTLLFLMTQKKYELQHQKTENSKNYDKKIQKCQELIDTLLYQQMCKSTKTQPSPEHGYATDGFPVKYLGISWGQWFAEQITDLMDGKTKSIKSAMGAFNEKRLYWVWGGGLLKTVLELLPPDFFNLEQAKQTIQIPDPYTGCLSWALYYFRFSLNFSLLLKHTVSHPWMTEEEKSTPWTERFLTQWDQRKFTLLNDFVWATGNILCFFLLKGPGALGTAGDALTLALLMFDISLAVWEFAEEETNYNKEMLDYKNNIKELKNQIKQSKDEAELEEYKLRLYALKRAKKQCKRDWDHKKINLIINISYAVGLMLAFFLLATPFLPALAIAGPAGAVLCFALTVIFNVVKGALEINKTKQSVNDIKDDLKNKIEAFKKLGEQETAGMDDDKRRLLLKEKQFLFLEIKQLMAETEYQKQMVTLQTVHLIRSTIFEIVFPAVVFVSIVFLPLGFGFAGLGAIIAILGAVSLLAIGSNLLVNTLFTPEKDPLQPLDNQEFAAFCKDPDGWSKKLKNSNNFFASKEKEPIVKAIPHDEQEESKSSIDQPFLDEGLTGQP